MWLYYFEITAPIIHPVEAKRNTHAPMFLSEKGRVDYAWLEFLEIIRWGCGIGTGQLISLAIQDGFQRPKQMC